MQDPETIARINRVLTAACDATGIAVAARPGEPPKDFLLEALGFKAGDATLQLLGAVDVDSLAPEDINALVELSHDEGCLDRLHGVRISRDILNILLRAALRPLLQREALLQISNIGDDRVENDDTYAAALTLAAAVEGSLLKVSAIDSFEDLLALGLLGERALATPENRFPCPLIEIPQGWTLLDNGEKVTAALRDIQRDEDFNWLPWLQGQLAAGQKFLMRSPTGEVWDFSNRKF